MTDDKTRVVVVGGTGRIGTALLAAALAQMGHEAALVDENFKVLDRGFERLSMAHFCKPGVYQPPTDRGKTYTPPHQKQRRNKKRNKR